MKNRQLQNGFSLVEVLMASGILAVGLLMIAGTFPVGIFLTAGAVEQTIAPIAADEAFAKIQLYGINLNTVISNHLPAFTDAIRCDDFNNINMVKASGGSNQINDKEYLYPSDNSIDGRVYSWSAICRRLADSNDALVQVTVFVGRKTGAGLKYYRLDNSGNIINDGSQPTPVRVNVPTVNFNKIEVDRSFITDGCTIVADVSGNIYRVLDHASAGGIVECTLDKNWTDGGSDVWLVPPPVSGGRSPVIGVYQRIIKF